MKIALISPEVVPFAKTGGLADVSGILPEALNKLGQKCVVIMPLYRRVLQNGFQPKPIQSGMSIHLGWEQYMFNLCYLKYKHTEVYFIDHPRFYDREELYGTPKGDYPDNALRYAFFAKAALWTINYLGGSDVIHCNDWQSALVPFYVKFLLKKDRETATLLTIHNLAYQGVFPADVMPLVDVPGDFFVPDKLEFYGKFSFMKAGILYSDAVSTVSRGYAREILSAEFGCGLDGLLRTRSSSLYGILNGADYDEWSPQTDKYIVKNYDEKSFAGKMQCKKDLLACFHLPFDANKPVAAVVTRLAEQKGIDLIAQDIERILSLGVYFILLGTGSEEYNNFFINIARQHKKCAGVKIGFDNVLAHKIEAGSDIFLMPSRYEPCGLNQMYSLKYATVPVVRATGGLDDTIEDFNPQTNKGNGIKFAAASSEALLTALKRAVALYHNKKQWRILQQNGLRCDFSWEHSAKEYLRLYKQIVNGKKVI